MHIKLTFFFKSFKLWPNYKNVATSHDETSSVGSNNIWQLGLYFYSVFLQCLLQAIHHLNALRVKSQNLKTKQKLHALCVHGFSISPQVWQDFIAVTFMRRHALIFISELKHLSEHEGLLTWKWCTLCSNLLSNASRGLQFTVATLYSNECTSKIKSISRTWKV